MGAKDRAWFGSLLGLGLAACADKAGDDAQPPACEAGTMPGGGLAWSVESVDPQPEGGFARMAPTPDGGVVGVSTVREGEAADVIVHAFDAEGVGLWSARHDGAAGLDDDGLDVAIENDGTVHVLARELLSEEAWEYGYAGDGRLVRLTYDGSAELSSRFEWDKPPPEPMRDYRPSGAIGVVGAVSTIVGWVDGESPELLRVDAAGAVLFETMLELPAETIIKEGRVTWTSDVFLAGSTRAVSTDEDGWIGKYGSDGSTAWTVVVEGENIERVVVAPHSDGGAFVYWGGELGTGTGGASMGRVGANGDLLWSHVVDTPEIDGYSGRLATLCTGDSVLAVGTVSGLVVRRIDGDGVEVWRSEHALADAVVDDVVALGSGDVAVAASNPSAWLGRVRVGG